ncbi:MAG: transcriptional regulator [Thermodesulfatator sp.]|nr:MAG: transcriptional regulator [Thermodesulfatator sp.]
MNEPTISKISTRLKALSDPTRIKILVMLSKKACCVCELTAALELAQPTISRHLKQLELAGFVTGTREKNWIIYRISPMEDCCRQLLNIVIVRAEQDPEARQLLERLQSMNRNCLTNTGKTFEAVP